jgi:hypothetical protein
MSYKKTCKKGGTEGVSSWTIEDVASKFELIKWHLYTNL